MGRRLCRPRSRLALADLHDGRTRCPSLKSCRRCSRRTASFHRTEIHELRLAAEALIYLRFSRIETFGLAANLTATCELIKITSLLRDRFANRTSTSVT